MLSLLTCSASRLDSDDFDPPFAVPAPARVHRRVSNSFAFVKAIPRKRRVSKSSIGKPTDFRHELHIGKDVVPENMVTVWDTARWEQELKKDSRSSLPSSIAPSTVPSSPTNPNRAKRSSITPQKRKPVPSLIPDFPPVPSLIPDVPPVPSAVEVAHAIPLPPSPTESISERESSVSEIPDSLLDPARPSLSISEDETASISKMVEDESHCEIALTLKDDADDQ